MNARVDLRISAKYLTLLVDHVADTLRVRRFGTVAGAVGQPDAAFRIGEQSKRKTKLVGKGGIVLDRVETDPDHRDIVFLVVIVIVPDTAALGRTSRRAGLRIEPEQNLVAAQGRKSHGIAVMVGEGEVRRNIAGLEHKGFLP